MRLPLRALPLAIRVATKVRKAAFALYEAACALESDLESMVEPQTVEDLATTVYRPGCCIDCGTTDPTGMCDSCAVLNTGRLPS